MGLRFEALPCGSYYYECSSGEGCSVLGSTVPARCWHRFNFPVQQGILFPESTFSADSVMVPVHPPCAITCVNICVHIKGPVARVRVRWIVGTLKHPACTIGWVAGLCHSWLSPKGKQPEFLMGEIPYWPYSWGGRSKHAKGRKQTSFSIKSLRLCLFSRNFLFFL